MKKIWGIIIAISIIGISAILISDGFFEKKKEEFVHLDMNTMYAQYDIDQDGKKDSLELKKKDQSEECTLYLNDEKIQDLFVARSGSFYLLKIKDNIYLAEEYTQFGGRAIEIYQYKKNLFEIINDERFFHENAYEFCSIEKYSDDLLYISSFGSSRSTDSFSMLEKTFPVVTKYRLENGKFELADPYGEVVEKNNYVSEQDFETSADIGKLEIKDGVKVKKGQIISVERVCFIQGGMDQIFEISVDGEKGWFQDSKDILFSE